jgi:hypothetical protein
MLLRETHGTWRYVVTVVLVFVVGIVAIWVLTGFLAIRLLPDWPARGAFGDMFNVVESLFSGLSLVGVIVALFLQQLQLELQRQELHETREELARSATAQEQYHVMMSKQIEVLSMNTQIQEQSLNMLAQQVNVLRSSAQLNQLNAVIQGLTYIIESEKDPENQGVLKSQLLDYLEKLKSLSPPSSQHD